MIGLLQRVSDARVDVEGRAIGKIGAGLLVFIAVEQGDSESDADRLLGRLVGYRIFPDQAGKMNLSLLDMQGGLLLVPQFTLAADTRKGTRPSFTPAATPAQGRALFEYMVRKASDHCGDVASGQFGADMRVTLTNDGPVTFILRTSVESL